MKKEIKYTPQGFSYVDVCLKEILNWGGIGVCLSCNKAFCPEMKLIFVLTDTLCPDCFNDWLERCKTYTKEDIEYDLEIQKNNHIEWYKFHKVI